MANKANLANSVLFAPLSDSDTELEVYTGDGVLFPAAPFYLTISPKNKWSRVINSEIVLVTAVTDDVFTITRAQKGTTAREFSYGDLVANGIYVEDLDDIATDYNAAIASAISAAKQALMPVGFVVTLGVSTNPATLYGFGTWTRIQGRVIVGVSDSDGDFDLNDTGGAKTHIHGMDDAWGYMDLTGGATYVRRKSGIGSWSSLNNESTTWAGGSGTRDSGLQLGGNTEDGSSLPPYISKYVWERTA